MTFATLVRKPTGLTPLLMSCTAFALIVWVLTTVGITHPSDEQAPARVFQLLILLQIPLTVLFALRWLPRSPWSASLVLLLQIAAALAAIGTILWLE